MEKKRKIESEIDFKAVIKKPLRMFGLVYIYFFGVALAIGIYYLSNMDTISFNTVPGTSFDTLNIVREIETKVGGIKPAMDLSLITNPTPELIAKGKTQFETTCASCHGNDGKGDGVAAAALNPKPRNFHETTGWTNGRTFYDIYKTVNNGVPGTGMTGYEFISPEDRVAIIHYIRTMADFPPVTEDEVKNKLDAEYNLSAGIVEPNRIPIKKSINLLTEENKNKVETASLIAEKITSDNCKDALLFKNNVQNIERVIYTFIANMQGTDFNSFVKILNANSVDLGYKASALNLADNDLKSIYSYLKRISG